MGESTFCDVPSALQKHSALLVPKLTSLWSVLLPSLIISFHYYTVPPEHHLANLVTGSL